MITGEDARRLVCKLRELIEDVNSFQGQIDDLQDEIDAIEDDSEEITQTFSSTGLLTSFTLNHTLGVTPTKVQITNKSSDAQNWSYYTATSTQVTVFYDVAPPVGTDNIILNVTVTK